MATRTKKVPVPKNPDGTIQPRRRAATVKAAIKSYTESETIEITATWNATTAKWEIEFVDE